METFALRWSKRYLSAATVDLQSRGKTKPTAAALTRRQGRSRRRSRARGNSHRPSGSRASGIGHGRGSSRAAGCSCHPAMRLGLARRAARQGEKASLFYADGDVRLVVVGDDLLREVHEPYPNRASTLQPPQTKAKHRADMAKPTGFARSAHRGRIPAW